MGRDREHAATAEAGGRGGRLELNRPRYVTLPIILVLALIGYVYYMTIFGVIEDWLGLRTALGLGNAAIFTALAIMCLTTYAIAVIRDAGHVPSSFMPDIEDPQVVVHEIKRKDYIRRQGSCSNSNPVRGGVYLRYFDHEAVPQSTTVPSLLQLNLLPPCPPTAVRFSLLPHLDHRLFTLFPPSKPRNPWRSSLISAHLQLTTSLSLCCPPIAPQPSAASPDCRQFFSPVASLQSHSYCRLPNNSRNPFPSPSVYPPSVPPFLGSDHHPCPRSSVPTAFHASARLRPPFVPLLLNSGCLSCLRSSASTSTTTSSGCQYTTTSSASFGCGLMPQRALTYSQSISLWPSSQPLLQHHLTELPPRRACCILCVEFFCNILFYVSIHAISFFL
ncbi:uncharacterized protein LOC110033962 isoform X1 [Phalaenopsis equestris]|uniref:uncharacterized protein LOC110033962 isoform X1 n=1 Tax=Phalaenopsis equestris TaxID=78828 RepID=UPI0009E45A67|nr:uncharacterized protein LOC110033962 isoform X1 [Phalaenopsis equestris]